MPYYKHYGGGNLEPKIMEEPKIIQRQHGYNKGGVIEQVSPSITTSSWAENNLLKEPIKIKEATKKGYTEAEVGDSINLQFPNSQTRRGRVGKGVAQTLDCNCEQGVIEPIVYDNYNSRVKADQSTVNTLTTNCGNDAERNGVKIIEPFALDEQNKCIRKDGTVGTLTTDGSSPKHNNRVIEPTIWGSKQEHCAVSKDGICPTLTEAMGMGGGQVPLHNYDYRIRKLTPKECWRLMDFDDEDFDKAKAAGISDSQAYKQAGNSIVVAVLEALFNQML